MCYFPPTFPLSTALPPQLSPGDAPQATLRNPYEIHGSRHAYIHTKYCVCSRLSLPGLFFLRVTSNHDSMSIPSRREETIRGPVREKFKHVEMSSCSRGSRGDAWRHDVCLPCFFMINFLCTIGGRRGITGASPPYPPISTPILPQPAPSTSHTQHSLLFHAPEVEEGKKKVYMVPCIRELRFGIKCDLWRYGIVLDLYLCC